MKTYKKLTVASLLFVSAIACDTDNYLQYHDNNRLNFGPTPDKIYLKQAELEDTLKTFTFLSVPAHKTQDTVYFDLYTMGGISPIDRAYGLEQVIIEDQNNAEADIHFLNFDNPEIKGLYVIPANQNHVTVPIILLRDESLQDKEYVLKFRLTENEHFKIGEPRKRWRKIILADILLKPKSWELQPGRGYYGDYSKTKHRFMMEQTGMKWDEEYMSFIKNDATVNYYWQGKFRQLLYNWNNDPENKDEAPLRDEFGKEVKF